MSSQRRQQPPWVPPSGDAETYSSTPPIRIYNSLTREKNEFIPIEKDRINWYACGPTVYDDSHLGHARNYMTTDIIRRILRDYFKFNVKFVMNITDVDDKIIRRAREKFFLKRFKDLHLNVDNDVRSKTRDALGWYIIKHMPDIREVAKETLGSTVDHHVQAIDNLRKSIQQEYGVSVDPPAALVKRLCSASISQSPSDALSDVPPNETIMPDELAKLLMHGRTIITAADAVLQAQFQSDPPTFNDFFSRVDDILLPYLDFVGDKSGFGNDHSPFRSLTLDYERRFFQDTDSLNILRPDVITRVTEYVPQIVEFVEKIEDKGFAYGTDPADDGSRSVYFNVSSFENAGNAYARLEPWNRNDEALIADGEGSLSVNVDQKRAKADFALWKRSKEGEPKWPSQRYGSGRPGWHIECSVMASDVLGPNIDIHSGGIDLAFPHHDNEIAQSEAYFFDEHSGHQHQWVNYFLHMGHLSIQGSKMSKSLKNFTTIRDALSKGECTPRSLRIVFLLGGWKEGVEITDDLVKQGQAWEAKVTNFFINALDRSQNPTSITSNTPSSEALDLTKQNCDTALRDSFDTPRAMQIISTLITELNAKSNSIDDNTFIKTARWISDTVRMFGLDSRTDQSDIIGWEGVEIDSDAKPWVSALSNLRDGIRRSARAKPFDPASIKDLLNVAPPDVTTTKHSDKFKQVFENSRVDADALVQKNAEAREFLALADSIRDQRLWDLDVYLEDSVEDPLRSALARPLTGDLKLQREEKEQRDAEKATQKLEKLRLEREKSEQEKEKAKTKPVEMYRTGEYSDWDVDGLPTKDKEGKEISKSKMKSLKKGWDLQKKLHEKHYPNKIGTGS